MEGQSLMDELFERIKILEEEAKVLEKEYTDLDNEVQNKKVAKTSKRWLSDQEKEENQKKLDEYNQKLDNYKKMMDENLNFPTSEMAAVTLKNPNFDESEILNFLKLVNEEHKRLTYERKKHLDKIEQSINLNKEEDPYFGSLVDEFNKRFKGRVIRYKNANYVIKYFDRNGKNIKALMLYDSNGIKVNEQYHDKLKLYNSIELNDLFENFFILSKDESLIIMDEFLKDNKNFIKIYFQMQTDKRYSIEKDLIPYKIEPSYIDINEYNLTIQTDAIRHVENKENNVFVIFESVLIGDGKNTGLVSSSSIKVYTTLYSKDIINILHIHLNDTSLDITIDSEFLEKEDKIEKHKVFTLDALGKRLTYKLLFKDYRLIKIYYSVSDTFIDEPPFEEIRIAPNNYVKIIKGEYKNYYGQVKDFPLGMLARKDKELGELKRMSSSGFQKEGYCPDRHLEELPGFVSVEVLFKNGSPPTKLKDSVNISIPVCFLIPLSPEEQVKFEKSIIIQKEMEIEEANQEIEDIYNKCLNYDNYIKNDALLEEKTMDEIKSILAEVEKISVEELEKNSSDDFKEKLDFISNIKNQIQPLLIQKIRYFTLIGKK